MPRPESDSPDAPPSFNPRMHQGGKLSFRGRQHDDAEDPGPLLVRGGRNPPPLDALWPRDYPRCELEIGSGKGAFLVAATAVKPDVFLLGIEAAEAYAQVAAAKLHAAGRRNGLLLVDNGKLYLEDRVDPGMLDAVHVYFPDPWPKRRHQGRRFFTPEVPAVLARALRAGGHLYFASDNAAYCGQVVRVMGSAPEFARDEAEERRVQALGPGHAFSPTNFERKYLEAGRTIRRYAFVRRSA